MLEAAKRARHVILGTATPIQTDVEELWDLLEILNKGADHVHGPIRQPLAAVPSRPPGRDGREDDHR